MALSQDETSRVVGFNSTALDHLNIQLGQLVEAVSVTGTALALNQYVSELTIAGTMAFTLAAPVNIGDRKKVVCVAASATPLGTLTVTAPETISGLVAATTWLFDVVGQFVEFVATAGLKWRVVRVGRVGTSGNNGVVIGTTVLTGRNLWHTYICSVTGTVSSTTTKALPDGSCAGELIAVYCSTAASTPLGTLGGNYLDTAGAVKTGFIMDATTDTAVFMWNGTQWAPLSTTGTFS